MNRNLHNVCLSLSPALLVAVGIALCEESHAEISGSLAAILAANAGTLNQSSVGLMPSLWLQSLAQDRSGWMLGFDYAHVDPRDRTGLKDIGRAACWVLRTSNLILFDRMFQVSGGIGWGLWKYRLAESKSLRGSMGLKCEIGAKIQPAGVTGMDMSLGYSGLNVPGTGYIDDIFYVQFRYQLFLFE